VTVRLRVTIVGSTFDWERATMPFRLGRNAECALRFDGDAAAFVSWDHAEFATTDDGRCYVTDLGSSNGTYVNGVRIAAPTPMGVGSIVQIGRTGPRLEVLEIGEQVGGDVATAPRGTPEEAVGPGAAFFPGGSGQGGTRSRPGGKLKVLIQLAGWIVGGVLGLGLGYLVLNWMHPGQFPIDLGRFFE
jgi:hypothetical protein